MRRMMDVHRKTSGFTLIELLIVVAIIGILAAIAIPNLLTAIQRSKQRRTMSDMRTIATAWEARATDMNRYNAAGLDGISAPVSFGQLATALAPTYIKQVPLADAWGRQFLSETDTPWGDPLAATKYVIISAGRDQLISTTQYTGAFSSFDCDIIYSNGTFITFPEGYGKK
jgi:type II secretion system protein G